MYSGSAPGSVYQTFGGCMHRGLLTSADGTPMWSHLLERSISAFLWMVGQTEGKKDGEEAM